MRRHTSMPVIIALLALMGGAPPAAVAAEANHRELLQLNDDPADLQEKAALARELYRGVEELLKEAEESFNKAARHSERGHEQQARRHETRGLELEARANELRVQADAIIQSARVAEMEKSRQRDREGESDGDW